MNRFFIFLWVLGSLTALCQWYVFASIRNFLFQACAPVTRRVAYSVLTLVTVLNLVGIKLSMSTQWTPASGDVQKVVAIVFFSYLGLVLVLSILLLFLRGFSGIIRLVFKLFGVTRNLRAPTQMALNDMGFVRASSQADGQVEKGITRTDTLTENVQLKNGTKPLLLRNHWQEAVSGDEPVSLSRRMFLKWSTAAGLAAGTSLAIKGIVEAYQGPVIQEFIIVHPLLDGLTRPLTFIQVTDFHFGLFYETPELEDLVARVNSIDADAVVLTGDIYHSPMSRSELTVPVLKQLESRRFGNLAVLGNHDFYAGVRHSVACLEKASIRLLRNDWITFKEGPITLHIGGIDDPLVNWLWGKEFPEFSAFIEKSPQSQGLKVLLSHRPTVFPEASRAGIELVLSGHTHGGQIILPSLSGPKGLSLARIVSPFTHGWYRAANSSMYLNRGVGLTFLPWRINCPPEIAVFHLSPPNGNQEAVLSIGRT